MKRENKKGKLVSPKEILRVIKKYRSFIVTSHINLEGDALGAQLALGRLIEKMGKKKVWYVDQTPVPEMYCFLPMQEKVSTDLSIPHPAEVLVTVDCPTLERIGKVSKYVTDQTVVVTIDHHVSHSAFGDFNWVDSKASATGEMIYTLYKTAKVSIDKTAAILLYTAIVTDTGQFAYSNTTAKTHLAVADLIQRGADPYSVSEKVYESNSLGSRRLLAKVLQTLEVVHEGKTCSLSLTQQMFNETGCTAEETDGFCNYARSIKGVEVGLLFRELEQLGSIKISLRSKGLVDVNKVAGEFGGGGHRAASGCVVKGSLEGVKQKVLAAVERALKSSIDKKRQLKY